MSWAADIFECAGEPAFERGPDHIGSSVSEYLAGRAYAEVYQVSGRGDIHSYLVAAVEKAGGRVLYSSAPNRAPVYLGVQLDGDERLGMLIYPFRMKQRLTKNRPTDEVRGQLRYGSDWDRDHYLGRDIAGVDITMILGIDIENDVIIGLDPMLYDLLPMGISFYTKVEQIQRTQTLSWHVWEKQNKPGSKRLAPRSPTLETFVGFTPNRIVDYARLERRASDLRLEPPLRFKAAQEHAQGLSPHGPPTGVHVLEEQFALSSRQIMEIIANRNRLSVAVRGGVAEHHLEIALKEDPIVADVRPLDVDAKHDFDVVLNTGQILKIECKNASPNQFANGDFKVEVQKTRASQGDPASRFYRVDAFDVVAACMYSPTGRWDFRFAMTSKLERHQRFTDRLAAIQRITPKWAEDLAALTH